jgi:hypothetical protein
MTKKPEDLMKEMSRLLNEIKILNDRKGVLHEEIASVAVKNILSQARSIAGAWDRAYAEFRGFRPLLRDIFSTYQMQTIAKREKREKSTYDIRQDSEEVLAEKLKWAASRFVKEFQDHLVKQSVSLMNTAKEVVNAAQKAETLQDENLIRRVSVLNSVYLPFELSIGDNLYANLTNVIRYSEAIVDKYVSADQRLEKPPKGGTKTQYHAAPLDTPAEIEDNASQAIDHIEKFFNVTSGVAEKIESLVKSVLMIRTTAQPQPAETVEGEGEPSMEPAPVPDPTLRRKKSKWIDLSWLNDSYINTSLK